MISTEERLKAFQEENNIYMKRAVASSSIYSTCSEQGFSLKSRRFSKTSSSDRLLDLAAVISKNIKEHGITQQLSRRRAHQSRKYGVNDKVR